MKKINRQLFNKKETTDVISYKVDEEVSPGRKYLGEIVVNHQAIKRNAEKYKVSYAQELARVVAHGVLHILGYEDRTEKGRDAMREIEDAVVEEI